MATYNLNEAKTHLSRLVEEVRKGQEVVITRYGVPVAQLTSLERPGKRALGFYPIDFSSDLLEPTAPDIMEAFYS